MYFKLIKRIRFGNKVPFRVKEMIFYYAGKYFYNNLIFMIFKHNILFIGLSIKLLVVPFCI